MRVEEKSIIITELIWSVCSVDGLNTEIYWLEPKTKICYTTGRTGCAEVRVHKFWSSFMTNYNYERQLQLIKIALQCTLAHIFNLCLKIIKCFFLNYKA